MGELNTISDSKEAFYKEFPYVIPHVFRRVADEILVELNLLGHQQDFQTNYLFALGLTKAFKDLTFGYKPEKHIDKLFNALCNCNNFNPAEINRMANDASILVSTLSIEQLKSFSKTKTLENKDIKKIFSVNSNFYNRLTVIGIYNIVSKIVNKNGSEEETNSKELSIELASSIGFQLERTEKDINTYTSNVDKLKQSLELMRLLNKV